ncbi:MAG: arsenosugar biosynthesis radical SAM (seleno)protein ArsS [Spirochaetota bacterium]
MSTTKLAYPSFSSKLKAADLAPLHADSIEIFQMNLGKMCNLSCKHCHVEAGPNRKEIMSLEIIQECLRLIDLHKFPTVDLTGGAPEMNPHFRFLLKELAEKKVEVLVRSNLSILQEPGYEDMLDLFQASKATVIASLPDHKEDKTNRQRGNGTFAKVIQSLQQLNQIGYGKEGSGLYIHLVHNPVGAFLPASQSALEYEFKKNLKEKYDISFNNLFCITNMPIGRFENFLKRTDNYDDYMEELCSAFNPQAASAVMCKNTLSIGYDGKLYDCDFNQMIDLPLKQNLAQSIFDFDLDSLAKREIQVRNHCYACTAGSGSSCQGATT